MAMKRRDSELQSSLWVRHDKVANSPGHPFYAALNQVLEAHEFDRIAEDLCEPFYKSGGRPSIAPGTYFRMLLVGYFEGISSERGIEWRCADSLSLRAFLGIPLEKRVPDHSSMTRIRQRLALEVQIELFQSVLTFLAEEDLLSGKSIGVDATTLEANAAMRSIVRRDTGESYDEFLKGLAEASGIETPTKADLTKLDKKRKKKGSNDDWQSPVDPDSGIVKMKDGRTHLAHKVEHAVDLETEAIVAVDLSAGQTGDTKSLISTLSVADMNLTEVSKQYDGVPDGVNELVADKGYHSGQVLVSLTHDQTRSYISEPDRGKRRWKGKKETQAATYANRRRIKGERGKELMKLRAEKVERTFAHLYETGGLRRCWLRGTFNIMKRLLIHAAAYNLSLVMRKRTGFGTPRGLAGRLTSMLNDFSVLLCSYKSDWLTSWSIFSKFKLISA